MRGSRRRSKQLDDLGALLAAVTANAVTIEGNRGALGILSESLIATGRPPCACQYRPIGQLWADDPLLGAWAVCADFLCLWNAPKHNAYSECIGQIWLLRLLGRSDETIV